MLKPTVIIVADHRSSSGDSSFMACVIAQRRVHPVVLRGNPLTEHKVLLVRACERVDQQVPSFTGWKWRPQPRRSEGIPLALRAHHLRDALTCVTCWRPSPTTGKVRLLTSSLAAFLCVFRVFGWNHRPSARLEFWRRLRSFRAPVSCVSEGGERRRTQKSARGANFEAAKDTFFVLKHPKCHRSLSAIKGSSWHRARKRQRASLVMAFSCHKLVHQRAWDDLYGNY